jgi:hypothetical protein
MIPAHTFRKGNRYRLPSGNVVELISRSPNAVLEMAYIVNGEVVPPGRGLHGRVSLRADFIQQHGRQVQ